MTLGGLVWHSSVGLGQVDLREDKMENVMLCHRIQLYLKSAEEGSDGYNWDVSEPAGTTTWNSISRHLTNYSEERGFAIPTEALQQRNRSPPRQGNSSTFLVRQYQKNSMHNDLPDPGKGYYYNNRWSLWQNAAHIKPNRRPGGVLRSIHVGLNDWAGMGSMIAKNVPAILHTISASKNAMSFTLP